MGEGVGEEDELGQIDRERGGENGKEPKERERERKRPRPDILTLHILISFGCHFHTPLSMTPYISLPRNSLQLTLLLFMNSDGGKVGADI